MDPIKITSITTHHCSRCPPAAAAIRTSCLLSFTRTRGFVRIGPQNEIRLCCTSNQGRQCLGDDWGLLVLLLLCSSFILPGLRCGRWIRPGLRIWCSWSRIEGWAIDRRNIWRELAAVCGMNAVWRSGLQELRWRCGNGWESASWERKAQQSWEADEDEWDSEILWTTQCPLKSKSWPHGFWL